MDRKEAEKILNASEHLEVQYQNVPVWIENVQETTADVTIMGTNRRINVPLEELEDMERPLSEENIYGLQ
ncbi:MAG: small, acid-soluble spore protein, H family [Dethiobacteraceae bacterium]|jgi:H-type small acid-soluble spore protein|nr:small, acid-soluble spore protein, H family [Bacillota bacterium]